MIFYTCVGATEQEIESHLFENYPKVEFSTSFREMKDGNFRVKILRLCRNQTEVIDFIKQKIKEENSYEFFTSNIERAKELFKHNEFTLYEDGKTGSRVSSLIFKK